MNHKGKIPAGGKLLKTFGPKKTLGLYAIKASKNWLSLKLVLMAGAAPKANFVLYWNGDRVGGNDFNILKAHQPDEAENITRFLKENFPDSGSLTGPMQGAAAPVAEKTISGGYRDLGFIGDMCGFRCDLKVVDHKDGTVTMHFSVNDGALIIGFKMTNSEGVIEFADNVPGRAPLLEILPDEVWSRAEELLEQYFLEKELYGTIDNGKL